jgi:hypothetical protein
MSEGCRRASSALPALCCWLLVVLAVAVRGMSESASSVSEAMRGCGIIRPSAPLTRYSTPTAQSHPARGSRTHLAASLTAWIGSPPAQSAASASSCGIAVLHLPSSATRQRSPWVSRRCLLRVHLGYFFISAQATAGSGGSGAAPAAADERRLPQDARSGRARAAVAGRLHGLNPRRACGGRAAPGRTRARRRVGSAATSVAEAQWRVGHGLEAGA